MKCKKCNPDPNVMTCPECRSAFVFEASSRGTHVDVEPAKVQVWFYCGDCEADFVAVYRLSHLYTGRL